MQSPTIPRHTKATVERDPALIEWWIRVTSPALDSPKGLRNPRWREEVTSLFFPIVILLVLLPMPTVIGNPLQLYTLITVACIDIAALFLKRAGYLKLSGAIILITIETGLALSILTTPGGFDVTRLPLLDQMLQANIVAMAFFATWSVFLLALFNCAFILYVMLFAAHSAAFNQILTHNASEVIAPILTLQLFSAALGYILIRTLIAAISRADRAEEIAEFERREWEQKEKELVLKQQLETGIQQVLSTLNEAANGNFTSRVPLEQDNILWRVGYAINNLLARLQSFKQEKAELARTREVANQLVLSIKNRQRLNLDRWTGTCLDALIMEMYGSANRKPDSMDPPPHRGRL